MNDRRLMDVTVFCRGVAVGTAPLLLRAAAGTGLGEGTGAVGQPGLRFGPASHLPGYEALIGRALRAYKEAKTLWTRLPYPEAARAQAQMAEAWSALSALWSTLELRDEAGTVIPIPVDRFSDGVVSAQLNELPSSVLVSLRRRYETAQPT